MKFFLLAVGISLQQVQATAVVDRSEVEIGQEVLLTVTVEASGNDAVRIFDPPLVGLEVQGTIDRSDVSVRDGILVRIATREVRLISTQVGVANIGSIRVEIGSSVITTDPIEISVSAATTASASALQPHINDMIEARQTPALTADEVLVEVWTTADTVVLGDQVDVVVLAWFPREVRSRLRNPPTLQPPLLQGAWTYQQGTPGAIAVSRQVAGVWYDVYVHHQVVFPLTPGPFRIGSATVSYSLPLTYSFLSREVQHEPQSEPVELEVLPQPLDGRPTDFDGASASHLEFVVDAADTQLTIGGAGTIVATLTGKGNVALWPEPRILWPEGVRVYPEAAEVDLETRDDGIWGTKTFRYLVVADSYGTHLIPEPTYLYFDPARRDYASLTTPPIELVTEGSPASEVGLRDHLQLPLSGTGTGVAAESFVRGLAWWVWLIVLLAPPLSVAIVRALERRRDNGTESGEETSGRLEQLESQFGTAMRVLVKEPERLDGDGLASALRAAGVEQPVAAHAARVRDRLWQAGYGPEGEIDPAELGAEVEEVLKALRGWGVATGQVGTVGAIALLLFTVAGASVEAQSAELLYEAGAMQQAADSFRLRAEAQPLVASHWYNLGSALHGGGADVAARAAWIRAARLEPRHGVIADAMALLPRQDRITGRMTWISTVTPGEALLIAAALWVSGWVLVGFRQRRWAVGSAFALSVAFAAFGAHVTGHYATPLALISHENAPLREAPYGSAQAVRVLEKGSAVVVDRTDGNWVLVQRSNDRGWLLLEELVPF